jgi:2-C-methyl-D-erythritol 4-phosphate cytidylyltransferase
MASRVSVIICAAGGSTRFGGKRKKPFVDVAGRAVFIRSIEFFADRDDVCQVILAISAEDEELVSVKWGPNLKFFGVQSCLGGEHRFETVAKALEKVKPEAELVAVHDAVRCCLKKEWIDDCFRAAGENGAAILAAPVTATVKQVCDRKVTKTVDRSCLWEAQTPQVFRAELIKRAYAGLKDVDASSISDDAQLAEAIGVEVSVVESDSSNIKITHGSDIAIAEAIIRTRPSPARKRPAGPYYEAQW